MLLYILLLVFHKFIKPNIHFTSKMDSNVLLVRINSLVPKVAYSRHAVWCDADKTEHRLKSSQWTSKVMGSYLYPRCFAEYTEHQFELNAKTLQHKQVTHVLQCWHVLVDDRNTKIYEKYSWLKTFHVSLQHLCKTIFTPTKTAELHSRCHTGGKTEHSVEELDTSLIFHGYSEAAMVWRWPVSSI